MQRISFKHGGPEFDAMYPEGIPTQVEIEFKTEEGLSKLDSGMVLFPLGHSRSDSKFVDELLMQKFIKLGILALDSSVNKFIAKLQSIETATSDDINELYDVQLAKRRPVDGTF